MALPLVSVSEAVNENSCQFHSILSEHVLTGLSEIDKKVQRENESKNERMIL